jgi:16S rRNA G966 N2-methylase RsmD
MNCRTRGCFKYLEGNDSMDIQIGLTTARNRPELEVEGAALAASLALPYVPREQRGLDKLKRIHGIQLFLILKDGGLLELEGDPPLRWHPGMALPRLRLLAKGKKDTMLELMGVKPGDHVLDCTMGFGADALVAACGVGETGRVVALEASPVIAVLSQHGIGRYNDIFGHYGLNLSALTERVQAFTCQAEDFLRRQLDESYDIVYFDPMFQKGVRHSSGINALRPYACNKPLTPSLIREALRVARRRVLLKERSDSDEFRRLRCGRTAGGKHSAVAYGIWDKS